MTCSLEAYRLSVGCFVNILQSILSRKAKIAAGRIRGLKIKTYAASIAISTLLVLLMIGGIEPHPGPTHHHPMDSSESSDQGKECTSCHSLTEVLNAINGLSRAVERIESNQTMLSSQLDERLQRLEEQGEIVTADIDALNGKVEQLEDENDLLKHRLKEMEENLDRAENASKQNNVLVYGIPETAGETRQDCEKKIQRIFKEDLKIGAGVAIDYVRRAGKAIIVKMMSCREREKVLAGAKNLAASRSGISVREDFSKRTQAKRSKLVPLMKSMRADGRRARLRFDKLVTDDGSFVFNLSSNQIEKLPERRPHQGGTNGTATPHPATQNDIGTKRGTNGNATLHPVSRQVEQWE